MKDSSRILTAAIAATVAIAAIACSTNKAAVPSDSANAALRPLTSEERLSDLDTLVQTIKAYYGPLKYKEARFKFRLDELADRYREMAKNAADDDEATGVIAQFLANFHDGHISIETPVQRNNSYSVPLIITPVENKTLVAKITDDTLTAQTGIEVGDEVVEIDGQAPLSYLPLINKYRSFATPESDRHLVLNALRRPIYATELKPKKASVTLKIAKKDGTLMERTLIWKVDKNDAYVNRDFALKNTLKAAYSGEAAGLINAVTGTSGQDSLADMGAETPFFASAQVESGMNFVHVVPSEKALKKDGLTDPKLTPKLYGVIYRFAGKTILLVRMSGYMVKDADARISWYKAILDEYGSIADALVLDQTHNPGGSLDYANTFFSLFANDHARGVVNFLHADRKWLADIGKDLQSPDAAKGEQRNVDELGYKLVEEAYDQGLNLTKQPISLTGTDYVKPADFTFKKPVLMLIDELAGSCGDIVPMLMKANGLATLFGARTMGLGGNVEPIITLPASQITVHLTRGFFFPFSPDGIYDLSNPVENNGVTPDIAYTHTVKDTRAGYVDYVNAFSKAAADLVK